MTERLQFHFLLSCIGEGNGNPLQCPCLENPGDGGAWWAAVCGVAQSQTRLKWLSSSSIPKINWGAETQAECYVAKLRACSMKMCSFLFFPPKWTIFKVFIEFVTISLLFYFLFVCLFVWLQDKWDLSSLTTELICTPCFGRWSLNHWTDGEVPVNVFLNLISKSLPSKYLFPLVSCFQCIMLYMKMKTWKVPRIGKQSFSF